MVFIGVYMKWIRPVADKILVIKKPAAALGQMT